MCPDLTERDMTRLSFLFASMVNAPWQSFALIKVVKRNSDGVIFQIFNHIEDILHQPTDVPITMITLADASNALILFGNKQLQTAGRLLAGAIQTAKLSL